MNPKLITNNKPNNPVSNSILSSQFIQGRTSTRKFLVLTTDITRTDLLNLNPGQLRVSVLLPLIKRLSPFRYHVSHIPGVVVKEPMTPILARWIITGVTHQKFWRDHLNKITVGPTMGKNTLFVNPESSVTFFIHTSIPRPTLPSKALINLGPIPLLQRECNLKLRITMNQPSPVVHVTPTPRRDTSLTTQHRARQINKCGHTTQGSRTRWSPSRVGDLIVPTSKVDDDRGCVVARSWAVNGLDELPAFSLVLGQNLVDGVLVACTGAADFDNPSGVLRSNGHAPSVPLPNYRGVSR